MQAEQKLGQQRLEELGGFWNYFRRRKLAETLATRALRLEAAQTVVTDLSDARHEIDSQARRPFEGLGLEGRRAVNLAIIACAESLCDRLAERRPRQISRARRRCVASTSPIMAAARSALR